jgi:hypothetical protein
MPKYSYNANIINFNYFSNRQCLRYKITDIQYEYAFSKLSSSRRDEDNNSEYDKYEAGLNKKDEAQAMQNKVAAEKAVEQIVSIYGPIYDDEIEHYRKRLTKDGSPVINTLQRDLVRYLFAKCFGDPITMDAMHNHTDYIKLVICSKRLLKNSGMVLLPYIISSKVIRTATRKIISRRDTIRISNSDSYEQIKNMYNNPKIEQRINEFMGNIVSSTFEMIDYDTENHCPSALDGIIVPMYTDLANEELMLFITNI